MRERRGGKIRGSQMKDRQGGITLGVNKLNLMSPTKIYDKWRK